MLQHQSNVSLTIGTGDDARTFSPCRGREGGGRTAEGTLVRPGGMGPGEAMAQPPEYSETTFRYRLRHGVDSGVERWATDHVGERVVGIEQPLDQRKQAGFHDPITWGGILTGAEPSEYDADGGDPKVLEFTVLPDSLT